MTNTSSGAGWGYYGYRNMMYSSNSWFGRGGYASTTTYSGIFNLSYGTGYATNLVSSRPVLTISRDFPWL